MNQSYTIQYSLQRDHELPYFDSHLKNISLQIDIQHYSNSLSILLSLSILIQNTFDFHHSTNTSQFDYLNHKLSSNQTNSIHS